MIGFGAMIHALGGWSKEDPAKFYGCKITAASITDERLTLAFDDGVSIVIRDDGQSCCEHRYMTCDDDVQSLVGQVLRSIEAKDGPTVDDEFDVHEQVFLEIATDGGFITIANHNEHNGYYGGFGLTVEIVDGAPV